MALPAVDVDYFVELDVVPFDLEAITGPILPLHATTAARESLAGLQHWYDLGFIGVVAPGSVHPAGWQSATTGQIMAYCMGQEDAASGSPRQSMG